MWGPGRPVVVSLGVRARPGSRWSFGFRRARVIPNDPQVRCVPGLFAIVSLLLVLVLLDGVCYPQLGGERDEPSFLFEKVGWERDHTGIIPRREVMLGF